MTTPQNLLMVTMDVPPSRPVDPEDLSIALAGAELIDLLEAQAIGLDSGHIVPGTQAVPDDHFLKQASASLDLTEPYESVGDWLCCRNRRALARSYTEALETEGLATWQRPPGHPFRRRELTLIDSPARRQAAERWTSAEPVLVTLADAIGVRRDEPHDSPDVADSAVATVLSAVGRALVTLKAERKEDLITQAELDNAWGYLE